MKFILRPTILFLFSFTAFAQGLAESEVVKKVDALRISWDNEAKLLQTYEGLTSFCSQSVYRKKITALLDEIHYYDTLLYGIVSRKFDKSEDPEAKSAIDDIIILEDDYKTLAFKRFLRQECNTYNEIENNLGRSKGAEYKKEIKALKEEQKKYVLEITKQIDVVDEHAHHLHLGEG